MKSLAQIGLEMVESNNQGTSYPVWVVSRVPGDVFPKVFLSEASANRYVEDEGGSIRVSSGDQCPDLIACMIACLRAAGVENHRQAANAYFTRNLY